jgi:hypothetical protein
LLAYFEFEVSLRGAEPRIWRRFLIAETASFLHLHEAIQEACGWLNCHLFTFRDRKGKAIAGLPDDEDGDPDPDARKVKLRSYFGRARSCLYEYDFGDWWEHEVTLQGIVERPEKFGRKLLGGERAFPPEDCGGIPGYEECVRVARGGKDPEGLRKWMGGWKPEEFDLRGAVRHFDHAKLSLRGNYEEVF